VVLSNQLKALRLSGAVPAFAGGRQRARATLGDGDIRMKLLQNNEKLRCQKKSFPVVIPGDLFNNSERSNRGWICGHFDPDAGPD
jgi:hypothetical protein